MNERIEELALLSGMVKILDEHAHEYGNGTFKRTPYPELEKFAELIVKECVLEAMDAVHHNNSIRLQLYNHFGIA